MAGAISLAEMQPFTVYSIDLRRCKKQGIGCKAESQALSARYQESNSVADGGGKTPSNVHHLNVVAVHRSSCGTYKILCIGFATEITACINFSRTQFLPQSSNRCWNKESGIYILGLRQRISRFPTYKTFVDL
jgi:hypothetical protein